MTNPQNSRVTIEPVTQQDYADWLPLWKSYQVFYRVDIPDDISRLTWSRFLNPIEPIFGAVAKCDGKIVGLVHYLFHRSTWADTDYCYLEDLFVSEALRGQQIGKRLLNMCSSRPASATLPISTGIPMKLTCAASGCMTGLPGKAA